MSTSGNAGLVSVEVPNAEPPFPFRYGLEWGLRNPWDHQLGPLYQYLPTGSIPDRRGG